MNRRVAGIRRADDRTAHYLNSILDSAPYCDGIASVCFSFEAVELGCVLVGGDLGANLS